MYRAIGDENSWRDGVFSHAAPFQDYQSSVQQFEEGSLGAFVRPAPGGAALSRNRRSARRPAMHGMQGLGSAFRDGSLGSAYRDGSLGRAFRDGSLGDASAPTITPTTIQVGPNGLTVVPTPPPPTPYYRRPAVAIGLAGAAAVILYLALRK